LNAGLPNPYLQWEETRKLSVGLEFSIFKNRLISSVDFIRNRSSNQLVSYDLPSMTGVSSIIKNFPGLIQNSAVEFQSSSVNVRSSNFVWKTTFNFTLPSNKLLRFDNIESSSYANKYKVGSPITIAKVFRFADVNTQTGTYEFYDKDGNLVSTPKTNFDDTKYINIAPTFYGGLMNSLTFKNFQFDFFIQFTKQVNLDYTMIGGGSTLPGNLGNVTTRVLDRWQEKGDQTKVQKVSNGSQVASPFIYAASSDLVYTDMSFIKLRNVSLSYALPKSILKKCHLSNVRVYSQAQNVLTLTKYKGLDPEIGGGTQRLPQLLTWVFGIQLSF